MNGSAIVGASRPLAAPTGKKTRPPTLSLGSSAKRPTPSNTIIELETPVDERPVQPLPQPVSLDAHSSRSPPLAQAPRSPNKFAASSSNTNTNTNPLASNAVPSSSMLFSPTSAGTSHHHDSPLDLSADDLARELAVVEQLRRSVQKNLKLRPIHKTTSDTTNAQGSPPHSPSAAESRPVSIVSTWSDYTQARSDSPVSSVNSPSLYFTPLSEAGPGSARYIGSGGFSDHRYSNGYSYAYTNGSGNNNNGMGSAFGASFPPIESPPAHPVHPPIHEKDEYGHHLRHQRQYYPDSPPPPPPAPPATAQPQQLRQVQFPRTVSPPPFASKAQTHISQAPAPVSQLQSPPQRLASSARPLDCSLLVSRLLAPTRPLLIDTRPVGHYLSSRIKHSINMAIPSLILKRSRKPGAGAFTSIASLKQFITTDEGKEEWDLLFGAGGEVVVDQYGGHGDWDGDVVVFDEEMNEHERYNAGVTAWSLLPVIEPLLEHGGSVEYLEGGMKKARMNPDLRRFILGSDESSNSSASGSPPGLGSGGMLSAPPPGKGKALGKKRSALGLGLSQLDTLSASASRKNLPEVEISRSAVEETAPSPLPMMQMSMSNQSSSSRSTTPNASVLSLHDATPSPPPSHSSFSRPPPPRRPSLTALKKLDTKSAERLNEKHRERTNSNALRKIDTSSAERLTLNTGAANGNGNGVGITLPKLSVRTVPLKSATLAAPPMGEQWANANLSLNVNGAPPSSPRVPHSPHSPSHLNLVHSNYGSSRQSTPSPAGSSDGGGKSNGLLLPLPPSGQGGWDRSGPSSPRTPVPPMPRTPHTARPEESFFPLSARSRSSSFPSVNTPSSATSEDTETEDPLPPFTVSTILPNFLYLGPELTEEAHVEELKRLGVKRILNIAVECDDDKGLRLRERFERYIRIPMRDTVEEDNIARGVREVCEILGAFLFNPSIS